jgi:hypothetical protein
MPAVSMKFQVRPPSVTISSTGVDGRAGRIVDDDALLPRQAVQQARLADVGLADDRDAARALRSVEVLRRRIGQRVDDGVEHVTAATAVQGRDGERLAQPEVPQARGLGLGALVVDLVRGQHDRLLSRAQQADDLLVDVGDADRRVDDEQHGVGDLDRDLRLRGDALGEAAGVGVPAAGVDDGEGTAVPDRVVRDAVAGHTGHVLDDGFAPADDAVDQSRLADVGTPDHCENGDDVRHRWILSEEGRGDHG